VNDNPDVEVLPAGSPAAPVSAPEPPPTRYEVAEDCRIYVSGGWTGGSFITLKRGKIIDPAQYGGSEGIATLQARGVKLREV